jgi:hypothetical protein
MTSARHSVERTLRHEYGRLVSLLNQRDLIQRRILRCQTERT